MKKSICALLTLLLFLLAACAQKEAPSAPEPAAPAAETAVSEPETEAPETELEKEPEPASEPEPEKKPEPVPEPESEQSSEPETASNEGLQKALDCVDQDISALYAAIGEPESSHYEYSCSGPGDDGVLNYDGFIVFTYKENGVETVVDAEAD